MIFGSTALHVFTSIIYEKKNIEKVEENLNNEKMLQIIYEHNRCIALL